PLGHQIGQHRMTSQPRQSAALGGDAHLLRGANRRRVTGRGPLDHHQTVIIVDIDGAQGFAAAAARVNKIVTPTRIEKAIRHAKLSPLCPGGEAERRQVPIVPIEYIGALSVRCYAEIAKTLPKAKSSPLVHPAKRTALHGRRAETRPSVLKYGSEKPTTRTIRGAKIARPEKADRSSTHTDSPAAPTEPPRRTGKISGHAGVLGRRI